MIEHKFNMLDEVEDSVSGFRGKVMSITLYATGCVHYGVCPRVDKEGKLQEWVHLDETRLVLISPSNWVLPQRTVSGEFTNPPQM